jgi:hypothetical protein
VRLELSGGVGSLPQAPQWNADRRAAPEAQPGGNIGRRGADELKSNAPVGVPLPFFM